MRKVSWKLALKISGVLLCAFIFILFAVLILQNDLNPLALDIAARDFCYDIRGEKYGFCYWFFRLITEFGNFYVIGLIVIVMIVWTKCDYRAILLMLGLFCSVLLNIALKGMYMRERPFADLRWMNESSTSFPSGHSAAVGFLYPFIIYVVFHTNIHLFVKRILYGVCIVLIVLVMFSRMILGVHYLSDVLAGLAVGIMVSCVFMQLYKVCVRYDFMTVGLFEKIKSDRKN